MVVVVAVEGWSVEGCGGEEQGRAGEVKEKRRCRGWGVGNDAVRRSERQRSEGRLKVLKA